MNTMNTKLTYIEARDKIWNAYFRGEIEPMNASFCFCGTLCNNTSDWYFTGNMGTHGDFAGYSGKELNRMEKALIFHPKLMPVIMWRNHPEYEDAIFAGMLAALEVLKQIHRDRGDFIPEDEPLLTKRNLVNN